MIITIYYQARITDNKELVKQLCNVEHTIDTYTLQTINLKYTPVKQKHNG